MNFDDLKVRLRGPLRRGMELARIPPSVRPHLQDRLVRGTLSRATALRRGGRLWLGTEVYWPRAGVADVGLLEMPGPAADEVLVRTELSAISPGTERAFLNLLPGVVTKFPIRPGYSGVGTVVRVGRRVRHVAPGDTVAATEALHHASLALVPGTRVFPLPAGVGPEEAAFLHLGVIAQQGLRKARLVAGERVAVIGAGPIGLLAAQLARSWNAASVAVVAASSAKRRLAQSVGLEPFVDVSRDATAAGRLGADVVIEVTGNPDALELAAACAAPGGRIVLLGSTRGVNRGLDLDALLRSRELSLIGAHISTVTDEPSPLGPAYGDEAREVLERLARGELRIAPMITDRVDPRHAASFYRRLCRGDRDVVGAVFTWGSLGDRARCRPSSALTPPRDLLRKGRAYDQDEGPPSLAGPAPEWLVRDLDALPPARGTLRFGLIGCGGMGARHAAAIRSAPNTELVATMDPDAALARELAGDAFSTTSLEELLARRDVDAVLVATPNHLHESIGIAAARAGKHVVMEKPIACTLAGADELVATCRRADVALSVGYSFRYAPDIRAARRIVERGLLGRILSVQLTCYFDKSPAYFGSGRTNRTHSDWRAAREKSGGGVLVMNMSHQLDQLRYILGEDVTRVVSAVAAVVDSPYGVDVEDLVSASCEFAGGATGTISGTCFARGLDNQIDIRVLGDAGTLVLDPPARFFTLLGEADVVPGRWYGFGRLPKVDIHAAYLAWFADAVLCGRKPEIGGEDGRAVQAWMDAIYESARVGRPVAVALPPDSVGAVAEGR